MNNKTDEQTQTIYTTNTSKGREDKAKEKTPEKLEEELKSIDISTFASRYEWINLHGVDQWVKPYFDFDCEKENVTSALREEQHKQNLKQLQYYFPNETILSQCSVRPDKLSFHYKLPSLKTKVADLKRLILVMKGSNANWDKSVYRESNSKFRLVNRAKEESKYVAKPYKCRYTSLLDFVITYISPDAKEWKFDNAKKSSDKLLSKEQIEGVLSELHVEDFEEYGSWFDLMLMVKNSVQNEYDGFTSFKTFSKQSTKFDGGQFDYKWNSIRSDHPNPLTIKSLKRLCHGEEVGGNQVERIQSCESIFGTLGNNYTLHFAKQKQRVDNVDLFRTFTEYYKRYCIKTYKTFYTYSCDDALWNAVNPKCPTELAVVYKDEMQILFNEIKEQVDYNCVDEKDITASSKSFDRYGNQCNNDAKEIIMKTENQNIRMNSVKHLLPVEKIVIDLKTGDARLRNEQDYFTYSKLNDLVYSCADKDKPCPYWEEVFSRLFSRNTELIEYFHKLLGCWASGEKYVRCCFMVGKGNNGKSKIIEAIQSVLYSAKFNKELLIQKNSRQDTSLTSRHVLALDGQRLGIAEELTDRCTLNEDSFHEVCDNEEMTCKKLYNDEHLADVSMAKLMIPTNHLPYMKATEANKRRTLVIPITCRYVQDRTSPAIDNVNVFFGSDPNKVRGEYFEKRHELLRYIVQGARKFYDSNDFHEDSTLPEVCRRSLETYLAETDEIMEMFHSDFLIRCDESDQTGHVSLEELANVYNRVHDTYNSGETVMNTQKMGKALRHYNDEYCYEGKFVYNTSYFKEKGYTKKRGLRGWKINEERWNDIGGGDEDDSTALEGYAF